MGKSSVKAISVILVLILIGSLVANMILADIEYKSVGDEDRLNNRNIILIVNSSVIAALMISYLAGYGILNLIPGEAEV